MNEQSTSSTTGRFGRLVPLSGVAFAIGTLAAFLTIGKTLESDAAASSLPGYYAGHGHRYVVAGILLAYASILFGFFGAALAVRIRRLASNPLYAAVAFVGAAVATVGQLAAATVTTTLGDVGRMHTTSTAALQATHIRLQELDEVVAGGVAILLVAAVLAGLDGALPRWLAWVALPLAVLQPIPGVGFLAYLVFLLWTIVTAVVLALDRVPHTMTAARRGSQGILDPV